MSTDVAVLGVGMHPWGKWGRNFAPVGGGCPDDPDWLRFRLLGATNPIYFALYARRMAMFGATQDDCAAVKINNARHGLHNPNARYRKEVTAADVAASPVVADPLRLLDICATNDGGAAIVLSSLAFAREHRARVHGARSALMRIPAISTVTPTFPNTGWRCRTSPPTPVWPSSRPSGHSARPSPRRLREGRTRPGGPVPRRGVRPVHRAGARLVRGHRVVQAR